MKKPPAPCVSWPIRPWSSGMRSSSTRASNPPGRKDESTASQSSSAARRSVVAVTAMSRPARSRDLLGEGADQLEPVLVEVDEDDLRAVEVGAVRHERRHRPGGPGRAAAEVDELDPRHA